MKRKNVKYKNIKCLLYGFMLLGATGQFLAMEQKNLFNLNSKMDTYPTMSLKSISIKNIISLISNSIRNLYQANPQINPQQIENIITDNFLNPTVLPEELITDIKNIILRATPSKIFDGYKGIKYLKILKNGNISVISSMQDVAVFDINNNKVVQVKFPNDPYIVHDDSSIELEYENIFIKGSMNDSGDCINVNNSRLNEFVNSIPLNHRHNTMYSYRGSIKYIKGLPNGNILSIDRDHNMKLWNKEYELLATVISGIRPINPECVNVATLNGELVIVYMPYMYFVDIYDINNGKLKTSINLTQNSYKPSEGSKAEFKFLSDNKIIILNRSDNMICVLNIDLGIYKKLIPISSYDPLFKSGISNWVVIDDHTIAISSVDVNIAHNCNSNSVIRIIDINQDRCINTIRTAYPVMSLAYNGRFIVVGGNDSRIYFYDHKFINTFQNRLLNLGINFNNQEQ